MASQNGTQANGRAATGARPGNAQPQVVPKPTFERKPVFGAFEFEFERDAAEIYYWHDDKLVVQNSKRNPGLGIVNVKLFKSTPEMRAVGIVAKASVWFGLCGKDEEGKDCPENDKVFVKVNDYSVVQLPSGTLIAEGPFRLWNPKKEDGTKDMSKQNRAYTTEHESDTASDAVCHQVLAALESTGKLKYNAEAQVPTRQRNAAKAPVGQEEHTEVNADTTV